MRLFRDKILNRFTMAAFCAALLVATGCDTPPPGKPKQKADDTVASLDLDPLQIGDKVHVDFTGVPIKIEPVETEIKDDGKISFEFIGDMQAAGLTPGQFENEIKTNYVPKYYLHLNVTVTPVVRFFYVGGMINPGGQGRQIYSGPITVTRAIQAAGDFNDFADRKHVQVTRYNGKTTEVNCVKALKHPELDIQVYPRDTIYVPRRIW